MQPVLFAWNRPLGLIFQHALPLKMRMYGSARHSHQKHARTPLSPLPNMISTLGQTTELQCFPPLMYQS